MYYVNNNDRIVDNLKKKNIKDYLVAILLLHYTCIKPVWIMLYKYGKINVTFTWLIPAIIMLFLLTYAFRPSQIAIKVKTDLLKNLGFYLLIWIILISFVSFPWASRYNSVSTYIDIIINTTFDSFVLWYVGLNINSFFNLHKQNILRNLILIFYSIFSASIIYGVIINPYFSIYNILDSFIYIPQDGLNYLTVSDGFAIISILFLGNVRRIWGQVIIGLFSSVLLYSTLSRTAFYFFIFSIVLYIVVRIYKNNKTIFIFLLCCITLFGFFISINMIFSNNELTQNRMFSVVTNLSYDKSFQAREVLITSGLDYLKDHWLFGRFMGEVEEYGTTGNYIHNWLSFWGTYGFLPFLLFIVIYTLILIKIIREFYNQPNNLIIGLLFMLSIFMLLSIAFSRSYLYSYIWFIIGAIPSLLNNNKKT